MAETANQTHPYVAYTAKQNAPLVAGGGGSGGGDEGGEVVLWWDVAAAWGWRWWCGVGDEDGEVVLWWDDEVRGMVSWEWI
ncbi:hypothetical protein Tco_0612923 [Tanacetum coccineum]